MLTKINTLYLASILIILAILSCDIASEKKETKYTTWSSYLGGSDRNHYSTLSQITPKNVKSLELAWSYSSPDYGQTQMNPIVVDSILYGVTASLRAVALNAATGKEIWTFGNSLKMPYSTSRGVSYWSKKNDKRILYTVGSNLYALNALNGKPIKNFGDGGKIDLHSGMPESAQNKYVISNTPGTIYNDIIVMPIRLSEDVGAAPGNIMAFNVITGVVEWVFYTIPYPNEVGYETWSDPKSYDSDIIGAANNWSGMSVDEETGIIYVPTGSAAPDFYGGDRKGSNLYANCLLALDAKTGKRLWHFQFVHHDIWDRDLPAPPNLITVKHNGEKIKAVAQVTKQGFVYVFDRKTGEPLFDIEEVPVPQSDLEGEEAWKTQPIPVKPKPFARLAKDLKEDDFNPYSDYKEDLKIFLLKADKRLYGTPGKEPLLMLPGLDGAAEWGGTAADPDKGIIYVNSNEMGWILQMAENENISPTLPLGESVYQQNCITCHQKNRNGIPESGYPSLIDLKDRKTIEEASQIISNGKGMMTGFPQISKDEKKALLQFLFEQENTVVSFNTKPKNYPLPYKFKGYKRFVDKNGLPGISPPWGTMHAIDLNSGDFIWSVILGDTPELKEKGIPQTGCENYGGPVVTENGLLFIGATKDGYFRAFNKFTGELLWEYKLPAPAFATPAMYEVNGKQFIAIACGGEKLGTKKGNQIVAFALN